MDLFSFEALFTMQNLVALLTLTSLEIVLGIDNIVFISILTSRLPEAMRPKARLTGLGLALFMRILLLLAISWVMGLTKILFTVFGVAVTGKGIILLAGGLFLIGKSTFEIHEKMEVDPTDEDSSKKVASFGMVIAQILLLDMIFSLDSVITAVGMAKDVRIMIVAVLISVGVMMLFAGKVSAFVERHPTMKVLALSFLLLIGVMLLVEGLGQHVSKGYIYFAMGFSLFVELINLRVIQKHHGAKEA